MRHTSRGRSITILSVAAAFVASSAVYGGLVSRPSSAEPEAFHTLRLKPTDDAFGTSRDPDRRRGNADRLVAKNSPAVSKTSFLKFRVTRDQIGQDEIVRAFLAVHLRDELTVPVTAHVVGRHDWDEDRLTYRTAPAVGTRLGTMQPGPGAVRWVSVTAVVTGPGTYSFALTAARGIARFASAESNRPPTLVLKIKPAQQMSPGPTTSPTVSTTDTQSPSPGMSEPTSPTAAPTATTAPASTPTSTPTAPKACRDRFPGDPCAGTMYYGASVEGGDPRTLEAKVANRLSLFRSYMSASTPAEKFLSRAATDVAAGRIPLISTKVPGSWGDVAAGKHDAWLLERIRTLATVDGPVWLTLHHEPRGDGDPADWVAMQQHARDLIDRNADNIALVGILNGWDFLQKGGNPGAYNHPVGTGVHIMGFDSYNQWSPTNGNQWKSAADVLSPGVVIETWGYPTVVGETGVRTDPDHPGRAADWLRDAYAFAVDHGFVGVSYYDSGLNSPDGTWALTGERLDQYATDLARPTTAKLAG